MGHPGILWRVKSVVRRFVHPDPRRKNKNAPQEWGTQDLWRVKSVAETGSRHLLP